MPTFMRLSSLSCIASIILIAFMLLLLLQHDHSNFTKALISKYSEVGLPSPKGPTILDSNLRAQVIFKGLRYPTSIAFLGLNDILVTEKDAGTVRRLVNGTELQGPLLNVSVATYGHRGMLGLSII
jgi:aldose sugar dehydrogenase